MTKKVLLMVWLAAGCGREDIELLAGRPSPQVPPAEITGAMVPVPAGAFVTV